MHTTTRTARKRDRIWRRIRPPHTLSSTQHLRHSRTCSAHPPKIARPSTMCPNLPLPRAATCGSQTPVEALQIADMRSYVLAPLDLKSHRVFDNMLTTAAAERESPAPAPSCDDSTRVQPWTGYLSHGSLHGIKAHTKASEVAPTQSAYSRVAVYNNSTRAESAHGGGTPTLGRRTGRGCRWCRMVVGGGHLSSRQYHSLHKRETVTVSQAWCTTAIMRLKCVSGGIHLAMDMRAA